jgi:predicted phage-related endonuclease
MIEHVIQAQGILEVVHPNMSALFKQSQEDYAMIRRTGLGATDAAIYLGVNPFTNVEDLIKQKRTTYYTDEEKAIAEKDNVRKGHDCEPLILQKFSDKMNISVEKPDPMYRIIEHPQLTINYDGVIMIGTQLIPVEAKWISQWADKYWNRNKAIDNLFEGTQLYVGNSNVRQHIEMEAELYGIPSYYYTQVQQQMLGLNAPFAYFAVLFDKQWLFCVYKIFKDEFIQNAIITESAELWKKIKQ